MATSYTKLAENLTVTYASPNLPFYTQAVSMNGANAVQVNLVIYNRTAAETLACAVQGSNDLENWAPVTTSGGTSLALGFASPSASAIAWQYVRLAFTAGGSATFFLSVGLSTAQLG